MWGATTEQQTHTRMSAASPRSAPHVQRRATNTATQDQEAAADERTALLQLESGEAVLRGDPPYMADWPPAPLGVPGGRLPGSARRRHYVMVSLLLGWAAAAALLALVVAWRVTARVQKGADPLHTGGDLRDLQLDHAHLSSASTLGGAAAKDEYSRPCCLPDGAPTGSGLGKALAAVLGAVALNVAVCVLVEARAMAAAGRAAWPRVLLHVPLLAALVAGAVVQGMPWLSSASTALTHSSLFFELLLPLTLVAVLLELVYLAQRLGLRVARPKLYDLHHPPPGTWLTLVYTEFGRPTTSFHHCVLPTSGVVVGRDPRPGGGGEGGDPRRGLDVFAAAQGLPLPAYAPRSLGDGTVVSDTDTVRNRRLGMASTHFRVWREAATGDVYLALHPGVERATFVGLEDAQRFEVGTRGYRGPDVAALSEEDLAFREVVDDSQLRALPRGRAELGKAHRVLDMAAVRQRLAAGTLHDRMAARARTRVCVAMPDTYNVDSRRTAMGEVAVSLIFHEARAACDAQAPFHFRSLLSGDLELGGTWDGFEDGPEVRASERGREQDRRQAEEGAAEERAALNQRALEAEQRVATLKQQARRKIEKLQAQKAELAVELGEALMLTSELKSELKDSETARAELAQIMEVLTQENEEMRLGVVPHSSPATRRRSAPTSELRPAAVDASPLLLSRAGRRKSTSSESALPAVHVAISVQDAEEQGEEGGEGVEGVEGAVRKPQRRRRRRAEVQTAAEGEGNGGGSSAEASAASSSSSPSKSPDKRRSKTMAETPLVAALRAAESAGVGGVGAGGEDLEGRARSRSTPEHGSPPPTAPRPGRRSSPLKAKAAGDGDGQSPQPHTPPPTKPKTFRKAQGLQSDVGDA